MVAGAAIGGAVLSAKQAQDQASQEASISEFNEARALQEKGEIERAGDISTSGILRQNQRGLASQRVGKRLTGTPLLLQLESAEFGALDAFENRRNFQIRANQAQSEADLEKLKGKSALKAGRLRAGTALLKGAGGAAGAFI
jgi:hypothetical protein